MGFDQYHEPANELPEQTRTFARMIASLTEEADAINWYEQRMAVEKDKEAVSIMEDAQGEEFKHFGMDLEFLLRRKPKWRGIYRAFFFNLGTSSSTATRRRKRMTDISNKADAQRRVQQFSPKKSTIRLKSKRRIV